MVESFKMGRVRGALALLALLAPFICAASTYFVSDDLQLVHFGATFPLSEIDWLPTRRWSWHRPIPAASWVLNYSFAGMHAWGWHLPNVCLHGANIVLAYHVINRVAASSFLAASATVLFAWSPVTIGTVSWISARPDLLATFFILGALAISWGTLRGFTRRPIFVSALALAALSSKESAYALGPIAVILGVLPRLVRSPPRVPTLSWRFVAAGVGVTSAMLVVRFVLYGPTLGGYGVPLSIPRLFVAPMLGLPSTISGVALGATNWHYPVLRWVLAVSLFATLARFAPIWLCCVLASVVPAAHLIDATLPMWEFDRFYYLASFWSSGAVAVTLVAWSRAGWRRTATIVAALLVVTNGWYVLTRVQTLREAGSIVLRVQRTVLEANPPAGTTISCTNLPDSLPGAYVYRNGCEAHFALLWPDKRVTGQRTVPNATPPPVLELSADGRSLTRVR